MKKLSKILTFAIVAVMAFTSTFVVAAAEEENADKNSVEFYIFTSINQETGNVVYTVAADASAHLSNFTIRFFAKSYENYFNAIDLAESTMYYYYPQYKKDNYDSWTDSSGDNVTTLYYDNKNGKWVTWEELEKTFPPLPEFDRFEEEYRKFIRDYFIDKLCSEKFPNITAENFTEFSVENLAEIAAGMFTLTKSPALNGMINTGVTLCEGMAFEPFEYTVTYNGVKNLTDEYAYDIGGKKVVDLFTLEAFTFPSVEVTLDGYSLKFPSSTYEIFPDETIAGTMNGSELISLECSRNLPAMRPGDFDLDGEITVRDLVTYQLFSISDVYALQMSYNSTFYLQVYDLVKQKKRNGYGGYYGDFAKSAQYGQYLQMYPCDIISYDEYCTRVENDYDYFLGDWSGFLFENLGLW